MGQKVVFDGKIFTEPVSRARIISGVQNTGAPSSFGNITLIDNGFGAGFGGGVGAIDSVGGLRQLEDFLQIFDSAAELKNFVKGGNLWDLTDYFYSPSNSAPGASRVFVVRAAQTSKAANAGTFTSTQVLRLNTLTEGLTANGVLNTTKLQQGFAWTLNAGVVDSAKFIFKFFSGSYRGADSNGFLFDGIAAVDAAENPILVLESIEVSSFEEFVTWANGDSTFASLFEIDSASDLTGAIVTADLTLLAGFQLFTGATETYSATAMDHVLDQIKELDNSFFLALEDGANAAGVNNLKILSHINNEAEFKKFLFIGGGKDQSEFASSKTSANTINSRYANLIHGGLFVPDINNLSIDVPKSALYKAALYVGRAAGVEPQVPLTYKDLRIRKEQHTLTESERVDAIENGVAATRVIPQLGIVVNQQVNTLQLNDFLINPDGSSPELSVERIEAQLNREIASNARVLFIGGNLATVSQAVVESFTRGFLQNNLAEPGISDGLIIEFSNVKAVRQGTSWFVTYDFQANTPINKIFSTGTIIDPSI